jgi:hypothetical protein
VSWDRASFDDGDLVPLDQLEVHDASCVVAKCMLVQTFCWEDPFIQTQWGAACLPLNQMHSSCPKPHCKFWSKLDPFVLQGLRTDELANVDEFADPGCPS